MTQGLRAGVSLSDHMTEADKVDKRTEVVQLGKSWSFKISAVRRGVEKLQTVFFSKYRNSNPETILCWTNIESSPLPKSFPHNGSSIPENRARKPRCEQRRGSEDTLGDKHRITGWHPVVRAESSVVHFDHRMTYTIMHFSLLWP